MPIVPIDKSILRWLNLDRRMRIQLVGGLIWQMTSAQVCSGVSMVLGRGN